MTVQLAVRLRRTLRGRNALLNIFELWIGLAGVISGAVFFYAPASVDNDALSKVTGSLVSGVWSVSYMGSGLLVWWGLLRPSPKWEVVGLWLLGGATAMNGIAIADIFGFRGVATSATLLALTVAAWLRAAVVQSAALDLAGSADDPR